MTYNKSISYLVFRLMMKHSRRFKKFVEKPKNPNLRVVDRYLYKLYNTYWKEKEYSPNKYADYQKKYWESIGIQRWSDKDGYDYFDLEKILKENIKPTDISLIDLGCGRGKSLQFISEKFPNLKTFGLDISKNMCQETKKKSPTSTVFCGPISPKNLSIKKKSFDVVMARSVITYIDEQSINKVLRWIFSISSRCVIISEPSGQRDDLVSDNILWVNDNVYKRRHDHSHIRDYSLYIDKMRLPFRLIGIALDKKKKSKTWVFYRTQ